MGKIPKKISEHGFLTNLYKANKYFLYHVELSKLKYKSVGDKYPVLSDARQTFYFRAIIHLCNFLKKNENLYLGTLLELIADENVKNKTKKSIEILMKDSSTTNLLNLRDKWVAHRDNNHFLFSQDFPDDIFVVYLKQIKDIIEIGLGYEIIEIFDRELIKSQGLLDHILKMKE